MAFFTKDFQWLAYIGTIISFLVAYYVFHLLIRRNREKSSIIIKYLIVSIFFLGTAALVDFLFFTISGFNITLRNNDFLSIGSYISFACNGIANILLLQFTLDVFHEKETKSKWYILYILEVLIGPLLFLLKFLNYDTLPIFLIHILCSFVIYSVLTRDALALRKKIILNEPQERVSQQSLKYIALSGIILFIAVTMFILHEVFLILEISEYITVALGWILGSIAAYSVYLGYTIPEWVKKRWAI